jgi:hypothetical protein
MACLDETLGSLWPPHAIRPWNKPFQVLEIGSFPMKVSTYRQLYKMEIYVARWILDYYWTSILVFCLDHGRMARGGHGLPKVSPRPARLNPFTPLGGPHLKRPHNHFRGGPPAGQAACGHLLPIWTPQAVSLWFRSHFNH